MVKHISCNLCHKDDVQVIQKADDPYCVVKCMGCGFVYTDPQPERADIEMHYQDDYYKEWKDNQMSRRIPMWQKRVDDILKYKQKGLLLDVGCGLGTFLKVARKSGFDLAGTEISDYCCQAVSKELGVEIFHGELEATSFPKESFDIITMWHTLEHMFNPQAALEKAHTLLKKDGLLVVAVPNVHNYIARFLYRLAKGRPMMLFAPETKEWHLSHFSHETLNLFLDKISFETIEMMMDLSQIDYRRKIFDELAHGVFKVTGKNFGEAIKVYARKK